MNNRSRTIAIVSTLGIGLVAFASIPGGSAPRLAEAEGPAVTRASLASPNPDLLRQLDAAVAPPVSKPAETQPVKVAAVMRTPIVPTVATPQPPVADPNLTPDAIGSTAVNLRAGPSSSAEQLAVLQPGEAIEVGGSTGGWVKIIRADGTSGWVYSSYLASNATTALASNAATTSRPTRVASAQTRAVIQGDAEDLEDRTAHIASALPAYSRPANSAKSVLVLQPGDDVYIAEVRGNWLRVETEDGISAWIRR